MLLRLLCVITIEVLILSCSSDDDGGQLVTPVEYSELYRSLAWPIDCIPGETCIDIGFPDFDGNGVHLHFEVWGTGYYMVADPWAGPCGPNQTNPMWLVDPPWDTGC
jgi:hypothetical protein